jgi:uracil phosphoribosyltransferase
MLVAADVTAKLPLEHCPVSTPLAETEGGRLATRIHLIPILRAGIAMLPIFLEFLPESTVGFLGIRREEESATPQLYYEHLPHFTPSDRIFLLDPMLATGGSAQLALQRLNQARCPMSRVTLVTLLAAPEGKKRIQQTFPEATLYASATDISLNSSHYIMPGLGDFGDRYFGNSHTDILPRW